MSTSVSVVIPCFRQAHFLGSAIDSALSQIGSRAEVLVVDDGSPDGTSGVAARYGDRVRYMRKDNAGLPAARNSGILATSGEFVIFLDADDYLPPGLIASQLDTMCATASADVYYTTYHYIDTNGHRFGPRFDPRLPASPFHAFLLGNYFPPHAVMVRRSALANAGIFDVRLPSLEDWDMWMRLAAAGSKFARTEGPSVPYRQYPGSMSRNRDRMRRCGMEVLKKAARYHGNCDACRRGLRSGRWGIRNAYLEHTWANVASARQFGQLVLDLCSAAIHDPALPLAGIRSRIQQVVHRARPVRDRPSAHKSVQHLKL